MAKKRGSPDSSVRQKWLKIFNSLTHMLRTQQSQLETLVKERKLLEDHVKMQHERWISDVRLLENQAFQMKQELLLHQLESTLNAAKYDLQIGLKQREAAVNKLKFDYFEDELTDFKVLLDYVATCSNMEGTTDKNSAETGKRKRADRNSDMKSEVIRLKLEFENLAREKNKEISKHLNEKKFVWNQYKTLESKYTNELNSKHAQVEQANKKISELLTRVDQLQSSSNEKDDTIARLKLDIAKMNSVSNKSKEEISRLSRELELSKKSRIASATPVLRRCTGKTRTTSFGGNGGSSSSNIPVKKESSAAQVSNHAKDSEKGGGSSKRKNIEIIHILETPKLFSSNFKFPKLKTQTPVR